MLVSWGRGTHMQGWGLLYKLHISLFWISWKKVGTSVPFSCCLMILFVERPRQEIHYSLDDKKKNVLGDFKER